MRITPVYFTAFAILSMFLTRIWNITAKLTGLIRAIMRNTPTLITIITFLIVTLPRVYRISTKLTGLGTSMIFIGAILLSTLLALFFMLIMDRANILTTIRARSYITRKTKIRVRSIVLMTIEITTITCSTARTLSSLIITKPYRITLTRPPGRIMRRIILAINIKRTASGMNNIN